MRFSDRPTLKRQHIFAGVVADSAIVCSVRIVKLTKHLKI
jgi:hypothetical protein